jgi:hypothetical protein
MKLNSELPWQSNIQQEEESFHLQIGLKFKEGTSEVGPGVALWLRHCATSQKVSRSIPSGVAGDFFFKATDGTMCPPVDSVNRNEYQENSWG